MSDQQAPPFPPERRDSQRQRRSMAAPDHGSSFVPGAGDEQHAPKSLDHFKRGHAERNETREKEFYAMKLRNDDRRDSFANRERPSVVLGLDVVQLVDHMERPGANVFAMMDEAYRQHPEAMESGKGLTAIISLTARRRNIRLAHGVWNWLQSQRSIPKNTYHYNSMIAVAAQARKVADALALMKEMSEKGVEKNEVTFSSAITACEKAGDWRTAINLLDSMPDEGLTRTAISYNAAISACEKGMVPQKACEIFQRMKREGIRPSVVTYSALISAAEKGSQWKLALEILDDMKRDGFRGNVIAYSAAISALAKGQQWETALELFREIQACGRQPSIVTYNATMTALEKGLQWEKALDLFQEMKELNMAITVVSYGSALSACDKGLQYRQCLEFLDEMTEMGIQKNVIIFGAAMSCMEKCCRADICFQLMERMKLEGVAPNVHIYNSVISACARSNLWEKGYELFLEMDQVGVKRDVVTYNAVLDAVSSQIDLGRKLFQEGVQKGFYARVSRLAKQWFELDLHFLSLGGGEIALGWWFEECLVPYMTTDKLKDVKSISIVTGYGKTRTRGRRQGNDGMRKRCRAMLSFMGITELEQPNLGRIHIDMEQLIKVVEQNGGKVVFDLDGYNAWKERETTSNMVPDVPQKIRPRFKPEKPGSGRPPFVRIETEATSPEYRLDAQPRASMEPRRSWSDERSDNGFDRRGSAMTDPGYDRRGSVEERPDDFGRQSFRRDSQQGPFDGYGPGDSRGPDRGSFRGGRGPGNFDARRNSAHSQHGSFRRDSQYSQDGRRGSYNDDHYGRGPPDQRRASHRQSFNDRRQHHGPGRFDDQRASMVSHAGSDHYGPTPGHDGDQPYGDGPYHRRGSVEEPNMGAPDHRRPSAQANDRKRSFAEPSGSRGYSLEPDAQRRRQS